MSHAYVKVTAINLSIIATRKPTPASAPPTIKFAPNWTDLHTHMNMIVGFFCFPPTFYILYVGLMVDSFHEY